MSPILLIHWNAEEARERAARLKAAGFDVRFDQISGPAFLRQVRDAAPEAVLIDLSRLPSQGRDVALAIRHSAGTRTLPLVFVEGDPTKVEGIRKLLPDAFFTSWERIGDALTRAVESPPANPIAPVSVFAGYSGTPLPKKLGVKPRFVVALVDAPPDFRDMLGELPEGVEFRERPDAQSNLILWFVTSRQKLERGISRMTTAAASLPMWIIWPKKTSPLRCDLGEQIVRETGLAAGLVDYKICAVDSTWSGLLFRRRKIKSSKGGN